jgi:hypothetical protein
MILPLDTTLLTPAARDRVARGERALQRAVASGSHPLSQRAPSATTMVPDAPQQFVSAISNRPGFLPATFPWPPHDMSAGALLCAAAVAARPAAKLLPIADGSSYRTTACTRTSELTKLLDATDRRRAIAVSRRTAATHSAASACFTDGDSYVMFVVYPNAETGAPRFCAYGRAPTASMCLLFSPTISDMWLSRCDACGADEAAAPMKVCGACSERLYCSAECQRVDWKIGNHKARCAKS